jgi:hypothetical protein
MTNHSHPVIAGPRDVNLFDVPIELSPRLKWLAKHGLVTERVNASGIGGSTWVCRTSKPNLGGLWTPNSIGGGETEDEAIAEFAKAAGIKIWNEEASK